MNADFATVMVHPPRVRCIGVEMLPFSLGHLLFLRAYNSRFARGEFPLYEDVVTAAFICAHTWEENLYYHKAQLRRWLKLKVWGLLAGKFNVPSQLLTMHWHIAQATRIPEIKRSKDGGTRWLISEWETRLYVFIRTSGHTKSEALNMPLQEAQMMFVAHLEEAGLMEFKSQREHDKDEAMTKLVEEMESEERSGAA